MRTIIIIFIIACMAAKDPCFAQTLWGKTSVGMTEDEVKAILPAAAKPTEPAKLGNGSVEQLRLADVLVAGIPFEAEFFFKENRLRQVSLIVTEKRTFENSLAQYKTLKAHLQEEWKVEPSTKSQRGSLNHEEAMWTSGDRRVILMLMGVLSKPIFAIIYQANEAPPTVRDKTDAAPAPKPDGEALKRDHLTLKEKAQKGDADAQFELGLGYLSGLRVDKNQSEAMRWILKAAEQNHAKAQTMLGAITVQRGGSDIAEGVRWLQRAAQQGDPQAQNALGFCYASGKGIAKDDAVALLWYQKAADQRDPQAQYNMGYSYEHGLGVPASKKEAKKWYEKSAAQHYAPALTALKKLQAQ